MLMLGREFYQHTLYSDNQTVSMIVCRDIRIIGGNVTSIKVSLASGWRVLLGRSWRCLSHSLIRCTASTALLSTPPSLPAPLTTPVTASAASPVVR